MLRKTIEYSYTMVSDIAKDPPPELQINSERLLAGDGEFGATTVKHTSKQINLPAVAATPQRRNPRLRQTSRSPSAPPEHRLWKGMGISTSAGQELEWRYFFPLYMRLFVGYLTNNEANHF